MYLLDGKWKPDPRRTQAAYIEGLRMDRIRKIRKRDRAGYDAYWAARFDKLFSS